MNDLFDLDVKFYPVAQKQLPPGRESTGEGDSTCDGTSCGNECSSVAGANSCDDC